jgi:hypothetical protein
MAEKAYGNIAPINNPAKTRGYRISTEFNPTLVMKAPNKARDTKQAEPMANPFPIAAVVFPAASN